MVDRLSKRLGDVLEASARAVADELRREVEEQADRMAITVVVGAERVCRSIQEALRPFRRRPAGSSSPPVQGTMGEKREF